MLYTPRCTNANSCRNLERRHRHLVFATIPVTALPGDPALSAPSLLMISESLLAEKVSTASRTRMRRSDRSVEDEGWINALLHRAPVGYLATVDGEQPFINSNLFVYDEPARRIYLHTARTGRTHSNIEGDQQVCFTVSEMGRLLPAKEALEFSVEYRSVVVFGRATVLQDEQEATEALQMLLDKYFPQLQAGTDYRPPVSEELKRTSVYAVEIEEWSGKQKQVDADFPGAFYFQEHDHA